jgi:hypothetical protein
MTRPRKEYKESTRAIVAAALKFAQEKQAMGWTKQDAARELKRMLTT